MLAARDVINHSLCSAVICKECIKQMPDEQVKRCVYCRRDTMEFYNKKYENISENIRNFSNNDNNNNNININIFGETTPPIHININNRSSNRRQPVPPVRRTMYNHRHSTSNSRRREYNRQYSSNIRIG